MVPESSESEQPPLTPACPSCGGPVDPLRARHHAVFDGRVHAFCSAGCKQGLTAPEVALADLAPAPRPWRRLAAVASVIIAVALVLGVRVTFEGATATAALPERRPTDPPARAAIEPEVPEEPSYGPDFPPPDFFVERDVWFHPLAGPVRRLPERSSRRFGAERSHESPESCRQGHCGVDLGEVKGETVLAVHDGVVERVVREPRDGALSGRYVRILHRGGSIVSQYMHLDAIEEALRPGVHVRAGETVGTVGDSGVQHSGPHLHFTVAVRDREDAPEVYIDPEPLLTLWPLLAR